VRTDPQRLDADVQSEGRTDGLTDGCAEWLADGRADALVSGQTTSGRGRRRLWWTHNRVAGRESDSVGRRAGGRWM
jgi:hypothetical protein